MCNERYLVVFDIPAFSIVVGRFPCFIFWYSIEADFL